jgi:hypothetical protein
LIHNSLSSEPSESSAFFGFFSVFFLAEEALATTKTKYRSVVRKVRDDPPQGSTTIAIMSVAVFGVQDWRNNPLLFHGRLHRSMQVLHATPKLESHPLREEGGKM